MFVASRNGLPLNARIRHLVSQRWLDANGLCWRWEMISAHIRFRVSSLRI